MIVVQKPFNYLNRVWDLSKFCRLFFLRYFVIP